MEGMRRRVSGQKEKCVKKKKSVCVKKSFPEEVISKLGLGG